MMERVWRFRLNPSCLSAMMLRTVFPACLLMLALARAEPLASIEEVVVRAPAPLPLASASEPVITAEEIASRPIPARARSWRPPPA